MALRWAAFLLPLNIWGQSLYPNTYRELSSKALSKQKDSLKKVLVCPTAFKEKETQKQFKEYWDNRTIYLSNAISANDFVQQPSINSYLQKIVEDITGSNRKYFSAAPLLLINRSSSVNAFAYGSNIICVNLGLISFAESREEIALVLAHELAHNLLNHPEKSMREKAETITSKEYKDNINAILSSKYGRFSMLKKIIEGYVFNNARHNRYHEDEADSLAIELLTNSKQIFRPEFFLRLDSADLVYQTPLKNPTSSYFTAFNLPIDEAWFQRKSKGLSSKKYSFSQGELSDSVKTHPECKKRFEASRNKATGNGLPLTPVPAALKSQVNKMIIWNLFNNQALTAAMYRLLLEKDKGNFDLWHQMMIAFVIDGLHRSDLAMNRFNAIRIQSKEYIAANYYELQNYFEQIPRETLEESARKIFGQPFWSGSSNEDKAFKSLLAKLGSSDADDKKQFEKGRADYIKNYPEILYNEHLDIFNK